MKHHYDIFIEKLTGNTWEWRIMLGNSVVAGGYCRTKRDAMNDCGIVFSKLDK